MRLCYLFLILSGLNFFLQMSDPQFGMFAENRDFRQETVNFEFVTATANRLRPRFVVISGDLINQAGNAAQVAEYLLIAVKLDPAIKLYNVGRIPPRASAWSNGRKPR